MLSLVCRSLALCRQSYIQLSLSLRHHMHTHSQSAFLHVLPISLSLSLSPRPRLPHQQRIVLCCKNALTRARASETLVNAIAHLANVLCPIFRTRFLMFFSPHSFDLLSLLESGSRVVNQEIGSQFPMQSVCLTTGAGLVGCSLPLNCPFMERKQAARKWGARAASAERMSQCMHAHVQNRDGLHMTDGCGR